MFRRILLGAVTALVVARPLVGGEDPGRLAAPESLSGLFLNTLWLIVALAGGVWLVTSGRPFRLGGWLSVGLIGVAGLVMLSAWRSDGYRTPGWLTACEWALLPVIYILTRDLTAETDERGDAAGGLLAAAVASAVSVAGFGLYQAAADAARGKAPDLPLTAAVPTAPGDDFRDLMSPRAETDWIVHGTLERSDTFFAFLLLLIPAVVAYGFRDRSTKSKLALGAALVLLLALGFAGRDVVKNYGVARLKDAWATAAKMIGERPLLGVGPGNFDRHAPRLQPTAAPEVLPDAGSGYAELAATCGVPALLAVLGVAVWALFAIRRKPADVGTPSRPLDTDAPRWEFYLGGVAGLLVGLTLRMTDLPGVEQPRIILTAAVGAVGRAIVWFLVFALIEGVRLTNPARRNALLIGLGLVLVFGLVSGAMFQPAVMQMFWVAAALAVGGEQLPAAAPRTPVLVRSLPAEVMLVAVIAYVALAVLPAWGAARKLEEARRAGTHYAAIHSDAENAVGAEEKRILRTKELTFLQARIVAPLTLAVRANPADADLRLELAGWLRAEWKLAPIMKIDGVATPTDRGGLEPSTRVRGELRTGILAHTRKADELDPRNAAPLVREFSLRATFATIHPNIYNEPAKFVDYTQGVRNEQFDEMNKLIPRILERDPAMEARLRYRLVQAMLDVKDDRRYKDAMTVAAEVKLLDDAAPGPRWKLTATQRKNIEKWIQGP